MDTTTTSGNSNIPPAGNTSLTSTTEQSNPPTPPSHSEKKTISNLLLAFLLIISFLGGLLIASLYFQSQFKKQSDQLKKQQAIVNKVKILTIGTDATSPPMEYVNAQGEIVGYDVDLGHLIGKELGYKVIFKKIDWNDIFSQLEQNKIDMIISSVTINEERKKRFNFTDYYINAGQVIVSRKDNPIKSTADLKGKKISVQTNTTNEKEALKLTNKNLVLSFDQFTDAAKAVSTGKSDAMISDLTLAKGFIADYNNLQITSEPFTNDYYGIVINKNNPQLLKDVNNILDTLTINGVLTDLKQRWLE